MLTFEYNDMKIRYKYMLLISGLSLINCLFLHDLGSIFAAIIFLFVFGLALVGLCDKVGFTDNEIIFNSKKISFEQIRTVDFSEINMSLTICSDNKSHMHKIGKCESDDDLNVFRRILSELISRLEKCNSNAFITSNALEYANTGSEFSAMVAKSNQDEKAKLKGIGGWLVFLIFFVIGHAFFNLGSIYLYMELLTKELRFDWFGCFGAAIVSLALFGIISLVLMFMKKESFKRAFIFYLICEIIIRITFLLLCYIFVKNSVEDTLNLISTVGVPTVASIIWIFAWKAYFKHSIRVENTFIK